MAGKSNPKNQGTALGWRARFFAGLARPVHAWRNRRATRRLWAALNARDVETATAVLTGKHGRPDLGSLCRLSVESAWLTPLEHALLLVPEVVPLLLAAGVPKETALPERRWSPLAMVVARATAMGDIGHVMDVLSQHTPDPSDVQRAWREGLRAFADGCVRLDQGGATQRGVTVLPACNSQPVDEAPLLALLDATGVPEPWDGASVLHHAVRARAERVVRRLLELGADPDALDEEGNTVEACVAPHWTWGQDWCAARQLERTLLKTLPVGHPQTQTVRPRL